MSAEGQPTVYRFAIYDRVYLAGGRQPYEVRGQMCITMAGAGEERRYCLRSRQGDEHWIDERHVYGVPTKHAAV